MQTPANLIFWVLFLAFVALMLAIDLGAFRRRTHLATLAESLAWTALWVSLAAAFAILLYFYGQRMTGDALLANRQLSLEFVTGYLVELALSVDNLFLFLLIFRAFQLPPALQHKVLTWGIVGAILMRAAFIAAGVTLLNRFHWINYLFGVFLIAAGLRLLPQKKQATDPTAAFITRFARKHLRIADAFTGDASAGDAFAGGAFTTRRNGQLYLTTLSLVLLVVETTDVFFAVDSIPAVLAVTRQPFIVFTSNVFAILGLRAFYFALAGLMDRFHLLHYGLAAILIFIGAKMLAANYFQIPTLYALAAIIAALAASILLSLLWPTSPASNSAA